MVSGLTGKLIKKNPPQVATDINGADYEANVSIQTFYNLPFVGGTAHFYTWLVIREDVHLLFGFALAEERAAFRQLVKASGIDTKIALGILPATNADELAQAIAEEDVKHLSPAPDIGKKTAERMVLELRDKLISHAVSDGLFAPDTATDKNQDIINTLLALGYNERETRAVTKDIPKGMEVDEDVRLALKNLLK